MRTTGYDANTEVVTILGRVILIGLGLERDDLNDVKKPQLIGNTFMVLLASTASLYCTRCCLNTA